MRFVVFCLAMLFPAMVWAETPKMMCSTTKFGPPVCIRNDHYAEDLCKALHSLSARHKINPHFFTRLIWQESRFDPNAVSPVGAQGIAQFMPGTAKLRGLKDPFNPAEALDYSAHYLSEMKRKYGNIGLASVGYNGGERRAEGLLNGKKSLPYETVEYVQVITNNSYERWLETPKPVPDLRLSKTLPFNEACLDLAKNQNMVTFQRPKRQRKPWGIQLAHGTSPARAAAKFKAMTRKCRSVIGGESPDFIFKKSRASLRRGYYMARLGRNSAREARRDCAKIKQSGCMCAVYKN